MHLSPHDQKSRIPGLESIAFGLLVLIVSRFLPLRIVRLQWPRQFVLALPSARC
ncbi:hypothetical protein BDV19DRAFT_373139 [Aspergillus venezuelensis]